MHVITMHHRVGETCGFYIIYFQESVILDKIEDFIFSVYLKF